MNRGGCVKILSPYFSDYEVISSLRQYYKDSEQYSINFEYWLQRKRITKDGIIVNIAGKQFLIDYYTGSVIKQMR